MYHLHGKCGGKIYKLSYQRVKMTDNGRVHKTIPTNRYICPRCNTVMTLTCAEEPTK